MTTCRSCSAPILWAVTIAGRIMPLDAEPNPDGNVVPTGKRGRTRAGSAIEVRVEAARQQTLDVDDPIVRYMPHHATCPDADKWRRR